MTFIASLLIAGVAACIGLGPIESRAPGQVERVSAPTITAQTATAQRSSIVPAAQSINPNLQGWPVIRQGRDNAPVTV